MKKALFLFLFLISCSPDNDLTIQGKTYQLENSNIPITLSFHSHEHTYYGKAVNHYFGSYHQDKTSFTFTTLSSELYTASDEDLDAEHAYLTALKSVISMETDGNTVRFKTTNGPDLIFHQTGK